MSKLVTDINGLHSDTCLCGSWLAHWEQFSGQRARLCSEHSCSSPAFRGAAVKKIGDPEWYIVPLCIDHYEMHKESILIHDHTIFISANIAETCGKK